MEALEGEANELQGKIDARVKKENEYMERRKWNIDNICKVSEERSATNDYKSASLKAEDFVPTGKTEANLIKDDTKAKAKPAAAATAGASSASSSAAVIKPKTTGPEKPATPVSEQNKDRISIMSYNDFAIEYEHVLETYSVIRDLEHTREYLYKNCNVLLHEHAQSYLLLSALEDEMNMKFERMKIVSRQSQILSHITELATSTKRDPRDLIIPFFIRIQEPGHSSGFQEAVNDFIRRIQKRAIEKRIEMDKEREEEMRESVPLGPGGLNPYEVLESLPEELREAFEEQDTEALTKILSDMPPKEGKMWMKKCVDSGLWVPAPGSRSIFDTMNDDDDDDDEPAAGKDDEISAPTSTD
jgi:cell division cycle protein 37